MMTAAELIHELRTPSIAVTGHAESFLETNENIRQLFSSNASKEGEEIVRQLELQQDSPKAILSSATYQRGITDDILEFSKLQKGQLELNIAAMCPRKIMMSVLEASKIGIKSKNLKISTHFTSLYSYEQVMGDQIRLQQILRNILKNAIEKTPAHGSITVILHDPIRIRDKVMLSFSIEDSGDGMSQYEMDTLLTPNVSPKGSVEEVSSGVLSVSAPEDVHKYGLKVAQALIVLMGGRLEIVSSKTSAPCSGTKITFNISCDPISPDPDVTPKQERGLGTGLALRMASKDKILIVDDSDINGRLAKKILEKQHFETELAKSGAEAVEMCRKYDFLAVLMDFSMPEMDGMQATLAIRENEKADKKNGKKRVLIIACSATPLTEDILQKALSSGMDDFLEKPIDTKKLIESIIRLNNNPLSNNPKIEKKPEKSESISMLPAFEMRGALELKLKGDSPRKPGTGDLSTIYKDVSHASTKPTVIEGLSMVCLQLRTPIEEIREHLSALTVHIQSVETVLKNAPKESISPEIKRVVEDKLMLQKKTLGTMHICLQHQEEIIEGVMDFVYLAKGRIKLKLEEMDPIRVLNQALEILKAQIQKKKLQMNIKMDPLTEPLREKPVLLGDRLRFRQILLNLIGNSIKFTPAGGKIKIEVQHINEDARQSTFGISIEDDGIGMSAAQLSSLFKPYKQAEAKTFSEHGGTGLGLYISKALIELMGGTIHAASAKDAGGKGSTFTFNIKGEKLTSIPSPIVFTSLKSIPVCGMEFSKESLHRRTAMQFRT